MKQQRIMPSDIANAPQLHAMLLTGGRGDLAAAGFEVSAQLLAMSISNARQAHPDATDDHVYAMGVYHALFDHSGPHNRRVRRRAVSAHAMRVVHAVLLAVLALAGIFLLARDGRAQGGGPVFVGRSGPPGATGATGATGPPGATGATGAAGGSPAGGDCRLQYNGGGVLAASGACWVVASSSLGVGTTSPYAGLTVSSNEGSPGLSVYERTANTATAGQFQGAPVLFEIHETDENTYWQVLYRSDQSGGVANYQDSHNSLFFQHDYGATTSNNELLVYGGFAAVSAGSGQNAAFYVDDAADGVVGWDSGTGAPADNLPVATFDYATQSLRIANALYDQREAASGAAPAVLCIDSAGKVRKGTVATCTGT